MERKIEEDIKTEKSTIIARRIQLHFVGECIACIILLLLSLILLYFNIFAFVFTFALIGVGGFVELFNIYRNNHSQEIRITYKNNYFTIYDQKANKMLIRVEDVKNLNYKNKKSFIATPYFFSEKEYNYGKLYIYYLNNGETYKLTLKNIAEPDKAYDKMIHILEWDQIQE